MKKRNLLIIATLLIAVFLTTSCKKDTITSPTSQISKQNLVGTYKVTSLVIKSDNGVEENLYATIDDCQKQSLQTLYSNSSYQLVNVCDASANATGTWSLLGTQQIIINGVAGKLISFNGRQLVISFQNFLGLPGVMTETLTKQ